MDETTTKNLSQWQPVEWLASLLDCHASTIHRLFEDERDQVRWRGYLIERREATNADRRALGTRARILVRATLPEIEPAPPAVVAREVPTSLAPVASSPIMKMLPPPKVEIAPLSTRDACNLYIHQVAKVTGTAHQELWGYVYDLLYVRSSYKIRPGEAKGKGHDSKLSYVEAMGGIDLCYAIMRELYDDELGLGAA